METDTIQLPPCVRFAHISMGATNELLFASGIPMVKVPSTAGKAPSYLLLDYLVHVSIRNLVQKMNRGHRKNRRD